MPLQESLFKGTKTSNGVGRNFQGRNRPILCKIDAVLP